MATIYTTRSVDPATVTDADIAAVFAEFGIKPAVDAIPDFFQPGVTYRRHGDLFRCRAVGISGRGSGEPIAVGFMPVSLGGTRTWEVMFQDRYNWGRGWTREVRGWVLWDPDGRWLSTHLTDDPDGWLIAADGDHEDADFMRENGYDCDALDEAGLLVFNDPSAEPVGGWFMAGGRKRWLAAKKES